MSFGVRWNNLMPAPFSRIFSAALTAGWVIATTRSPLLSTHNDNPLA